MSLLMHLLANLSTNNLEFSEISLFRKIPESRKRTNLAILAFLLFSLSTAQIA
jgi:hypothetical protein